jgi:sugar O-acyltransferase (sialic acid O-acetyltransferase NeuD family)
LSREVYVAGTRTFSAEVIDFAIDAGLEVRGLLEPFDRDRVSTTIHERPVSWLDDGPGEEDGVALLGTGENVRRETVGRLRSAGWEVASLVHPTAHVAPSAEIGAGALLGPSVVVGARSRIGDHAVLGRGTLVGHHTKLGEFATLGPGSNVGGNVELGEDVFVGMGAVIRDHLRIGPAAVIAMGAVVVRDVPAGVKVRGIPAAPVEHSSP